MVNKQFSNFWSIKYRIMKLATVFLIIGINVSLANNTYSQSTMLSLKVNNKTVTEVFSEIEKQSEYVFFYYDGVLDVNRKVKVDVSNQTVDVVLKQLFAGTNNTFVIKDRQIFISKKNSDSLVGPLPVKNQNRNTFRGKVLDEFGEPLPGAAIQVKGSTRGVTTDLDGSFELEVSKSDRLIISFLGMEDQEIVVGNQNDIVVKMKPKADELEEVTIVAFGKQKKESVIGAITTLSTDNIKMPVGKISTSLAGQLAGLVVTQTSGEPGAGANFWIRGISTFGANDRPLVLVDGIERSLDLVDAEDIESLSILKDATATAVYGVRGANGIVLITTKRGKEGKPSIRANVEYGLSTPTVMPKTADAGQWIDYYNDISLDAYGRPAYTPQQKEMFLNGTDPDLYPNVNWMKEIFKNMSNSQRVNLNISGGGKRIRYYISGSYYSEGGIFNVQKNSQYDASLRYNKFSFRSNLDVDLSSSTVLNLNLSNQYETKNRPGTGLGDFWIRCIDVPPITMPTVYSDGTISCYPASNNPYNMLNNSGYSTDFWNNTQSLIGLTQDFSELITKGLKANVKFAWDAYNGATLDRKKSPATFYATGRDEEGNLIFHKNSDGSDYIDLTNKGYSGNRSWALEASLTYDRVFNDVHRVGGLFLYNMREYNDNVPGSYIAAFAHKNQGIAARATYSFRDTYFIEGNFGYNGSENFSPGHKFGFFPSIAAGYLISNENYFSGLNSVVDLLKIKGSYGLIGSDEIGGQRFAFNSEMSWTGGYQFGEMKENWISGIATGRIGNPSISWETAKKLNVGLEMGFFNKLKAQIDFFHEKREGIYIEQESVPSVVGNNIRQWINLGKMQNGGVDASLEYTQNINDFMIQGRANFTFNRNKKLYDDKPTPVWAYREDVGVPLYQQRGLVAMGLFESEEEVNNSPRQFGGAKPGDIKYKDINGDGIIDTNDEIAIGRTHIPEINYGFGLSMGWRGFDLSFFFSGVGNVTRIIQGGAIWGVGGNIEALGGFFSYVAENRWRPDNPDPNAKYPRMYMAPSQNNTQPSTFFQRDMSFLRLKNAEFGYTIPKNLTKKIGLSTMRLYIQGLNLLTLSKFKMWDPELDTNSGMAYPNMTVVNFGLNVNL